MPSIRDKETTVELQENVLAYNDDPVQQAVSHVPTTNVTNVLENQVRVSLNPGD